MAQTASGAIKLAAHRTGFTVSEYATRINNGEKWCFRCRSWLNRALFGRDVSRSDGLASACADCRRARCRATYRRKPPELRKRSGPQPAQCRDGDKRQARSRINHAISAGRLMPPNALPCVDCGHKWQPGERRHEYDHYAGYTADAHFKVEPVCTLCHSRRSQNERRRGK